MRKQEGSLSIEYYSIFPMHCSWAMRPAISLTKRPVTQLSRPPEPLILPTGPATKRQKEPGQGFSPPGKKKKKKKEKKGEGSCGGGGSVLSVWSFRGVQSRI